MQKLEKERSPYWRILHNANDGNPEVLKRRALFLINKHIPKIMKSTNLKPIIKDLKVNVVVGEVVTSMEEREREDTSYGN